MSEQEVKDLYSQQDWGKLLIHLGFEPYNTECCAREVARRASEMLRFCYEESQVVGGQDEIYNKLKRIFGNG